MHVVRLQDIQILIIFLDIIFVTLIKFIAIVVVVAITRVSGISVRHVPSFQANARGDAALTKTDFDKIGKRNPPSSPAFSPNLWSQAAQYCAVVTAQSDYHRLAFLCVCVFFLKTRPKSQMPPSTLLPGPFAVLLWTLLANLLVETLANNCTVINNCGACVALPIESCNWSEKPNFMQY